MSTFSRRLVLAWCVLGLGCSETTNPRDAVILVTLDGLRWQDVFRGADPQLMTPEAGGVDAETRAELLARFWHDDLNERRRRLMPFLWEQIGERGLLIGNGDTGAPVRVTNDQLFSYPGYNEILTGSPDARIQSNDKVNNENITVLEWLNGLPAFQGQVAAFGSWDVFPYIINEERSGVLVDAGWYDAPTPGADDIASIGVLEQVSMGLPHIWEEVRFDAITVFTAIEYYRNNDTRVLYVALDETDTQAHNRRYDLYLDAARRLDAELSALWVAANAHADFGGRTTLIVTSDHGRGRTVDWTDHGVGPPGADETWMAIMGPYTSSSADVGEVTLAQVAATVAAAVGEDFVAAAPEAAPAVRNAIQR